MANKRTSAVTIVVDVENEKELQRLIDQLNRVAKSFPKAAKQAEKFAKTTKKTQIEMRKFGRGLSNASYQIQDFIVQVSGGVDPLRSFSQQAPQLLINMGALGAVVGVVAAGLPVLINALSDTEEEVVDLSDSMGELTSSIKTFQKYGNDFELTIVEMRRELGEQGLIGELQRLNKELEASTLESWVGYFKTLAKEAPSASKGLKAVADAARDNETAIEKGIRIFAEWVEGGVKAAEAQGRLNAELEKAQELFGLNEQDAAKVASILNTYAESSQDYESTIATIRDLEDALAVAARDADNNAAGLIKTIEELRAALKSLRGTDELQFIKAQGSRVKAKEFRPPKPPTLNRVIAQDPYKETFKQAEANLKLAESYTLLYDPVAAYEAKLQEIISVQHLMSPEVTAKAVEAAAKAYEKANEQITFAQQAAEVFEQSFNTAFDGVAMGTQQVSEAFRNMAKVIIAQLLKIAAYKTIAGFDWTGGTFAGQTAWGSTSAQGNAFSGGNVVPFAKGGVVNSPTIFPMARGGVGLMGEAGSEAVMPLKRMGNGNLGVESSGMNVTVNNMAQGVSVNPRQGSDGLTIDVVLAQAARAVQSGGNVFADSIEKTYSVNRGRGVY